MTLILMMPVFVYLFNEDFTAVLYIAVRLIKSVACHRHLGVVLRSCRLTALKWVY